MYIQNTQGLHFFPHLGKIGKKSEKGEKQNPKLFYLICNDVCCVCCFVHFLKNTKYTALRLFCYVVKSCKVDITNISAILRNSLKKFDFKNIFPVIIIVTKLFSRKQAN